MRVVRGRETKQHSLVVLLVGLQLLRLLSFFWRGVHRLVFFWRHGCSEAPQTVYRIVSLVTVASKRGTLCWARTHSSGPYRIQNLMAPLLRTLRPNSPNATGRYRYRYQLPATANKANTSYQLLLLLPLAYLGLPGDLPGCSVGRRSVLLSPSAFFSGQLLYLGPVSGDLRQHTVGWSAGFVEQDLRRFNSRREDSTQNTRQSTTHLQPSALKN